MSYWIRHYKYILTKFLKRMLTPCKAALSKLWKYTTHSFESLRRILYMVYTSVCSFIYKYIIIFLILSTIILCFTLSTYSYETENSEYPEDTSEFTVDINRYIPKADLEIPTSTLENVSTAVFDLILDTPEYDIPIAPIKVVQNFMDYTLIGYNIEERYLESPEEIQKELNDLRLQIKAIWKENGVRDADVSLSIIPSQDQDVVVLFCTMGDFYTRFDPQKKSSD